jgi:hypothetical protein
MLLATVAIQMRRRAHIGFISKITTSLILHAASGSKIRSRLTQLNLNRIFGGNLQLLLFKTFVQFLDA